MNNIPEFESFDEMIKQQRKDELKERFKHHMVKILVSFLIIPFFLIFLNWVLFVLPFDLQSLTYNQALLTTLVTTTLLGKWK